MEEAINPEKILIGLQKHHALIIPRRGVFENSEIRLHSTF